MLIVCDILEAIFWINGTLIRNTANLQHYVFCEIISSNHSAHVIKSFTLGLKVLLELKILYHFILTVWMFCVQIINLARYCVLAVKQKHSAASLCSITTEVLKVLNATEELIGEAGGESCTPSESTCASPITSGSETRRLDQKLTKMEEKVSDKSSCAASIQPRRNLHIRLASAQVYLTAGAVYGLEGTLGDLEHCARSISSGTTDTELAFLEDQVATAAAQVHQSELQVRVSDLPC